MVKWRIDTKSQPKLEKEMQLWDGYIVKPNTNLLLTKI